MMYLIKLSEDHYVIVDNSAVMYNEWCIEIHNGETEAVTPHYLDDDGNTWWVRQMNMNCAENDPECMKIISSTKPLSDMVHFASYGMLTNAEVEESIYGFNIDKLASLHRVPLKGDWSESSFIEGFNKHKELTKEKIFTIEDMRKAMIRINLITAKQPSGSAYYIDDIIKSLLPKTKMEVEFDEKGKLRVI